MNGSNLMKDQINQSTDTNAIEYGTAIKEILDEFTEGTGLTHNVRLAVTTICKVVVVHFVPRDESVDSISVKLLDCTETGFIFDSDSVTIIQPLDELWSLKAGKDLANSIICEILASAVTPK